MQFQQENAEKQTEDMWIEDLMSKRYICIAARDLQVYYYLNLINSIAGIYLLALTDRKLSQKKFFLLFLREGWEVEVGKLSHYLTCLFRNLRVLLHHR